MSIQIHTYSVGLPDSLVPHNTATHTGGRRSSGESGGISDT